ALLRPECIRTKVLMRTHLLCKRGARAWRTGAAVWEVEASQMSHELLPIYQWVTRDVLGALSILGQDYLDELKLSHVIFSGGDLEWRYRVEATRPWEWVYFLNLDHPIVPNWLWVNEVMLTEFGIRVLFTNFQQLLLDRAFVAPSQLNPNAWSSIRCFKLVNEFLELPLTLLSLEWDDRFPSFWSSDAGLDYVLVTYQRLNADQKDIADILVHLFSRDNLNPKSILGRLDEWRWPKTTLPLLASEDSCVLPRLDPPPRPPRFLPLRIGHRLCRLGLWVRLKLCRKGGVQATLSVSPIS
ncbi:hypothetical protein PIB30_098335, partial [Stylosanthes scabra]|nr:hypothetical protein [Stylosanthes scabra]